jgi:signal transduction histidine kinase/CheY-like chemotaxis protein/HPt (histidine-containing phosphotransfer) domain-containing protein
MKLKKSLSSRPILLTLGCLILIAGGLASFFTYQYEKESLFDQASKELHASSSAFVRALNDIFEPALVLSRTILDSGIWREDPGKNADTFFSLTTGPVRQFEHLNGTFIGFPDGRFFHIQNLTLSGARNMHKIAIHRRVIDDPLAHPEGQWELYDSQARKWNDDPTDSQPYDPRTRPWYKEALRTKGPVWTEAYMFSSSGQIGVTYAQAIYDDTGALWAVLGVDLSLNTLSRTMLQTADDLAGIGNLVFATDLGNKMLGHPDFVKQAEEMKRDTAAFFARYSVPSSFESSVQRAVTVPDEIVPLTLDNRSFIAIKAMLNPARAMPLNIYIARDLDVVLADAEAEMQRNVILLFSAILIFGIVGLYAVKLRVEVLAREQAEAELIDAKEMAEAATNAKSTFLATMSHEIRTPMNGVVSMAELLTLTRLDTEQRRMAGIINNSAMALLTIINDILDFSKIEAGKIEIETIPFSLADVVDGSAELLAPRADERGLSFAVDIDPHLVDQRLGDPTRIRQILLNLGGNAIKFTESGSVEIVVSEGPKDDPERQGDWLRFQVHDTGIGLTPNQQGKLFQAFVQADTSTSRKFGGTGLGLSICQRLSTLMGGDIFVTSEIGKGSTFTFDLPLAAQGDLPLHYPEDLSAARVRLYGLADRVSEIVMRYLSATGISDVAIATVPGGEDDDVDLLIQEASLPIPDRQGATAVIGTRSTIADLSAQDRAKLSGILTYPVSREPLWHAVAVALGLEAAEVLVEREDLAFAPPDIEDARAENALILVAEDNETNQIVIRQMLNKMGFACELAENGKIALDMLEQPGYGLLLTDFNMPVMDGFELTLAVREKEADSGHRLPILALTADALAGAEQACRDAGMDGFFTKPIDSRKLGAALATYLPQALPMRAAAVKAAPAPLDPPESKGPDWDTDIFDATQMTEAFGSIDADAKALIQDAAEGWRGKIEEIETAIARGDQPAARHAAHALKGAALSVGAGRLGRLASDIQDALDAGDMDMAGMLAEVLTDSLDEFFAILPRILAM